MVLRFSQRVSSYYPTAVSIIGQEVLLDRAELAALFGNNVSLLPAAVTPTQLPVSFARFALTLR